MGERRGSGISPKSVLEIINRLEVNLLERIPLWELLAPPENTKNSDLAERQLCFDYFF